MHKRAVQCHPGRGLPLLIGALLVVGASSADAADATVHIDIGIFSPSLTTVVADAGGFLEQSGITVTYHQVAGSVQQFGALRDGEYDLIFTSPDNVLHYRLNESNALGGTFDVQAVAGTNRGQNLSLIVQPGIESAQDLHGKTFAVDSPDSGFAYVLYEMLQRHGLERGEDYHIVEAGGSRGRLDALLAGQFDGTLLLSGLELRAEEQGLVIFEGAAEAIPSYLGGVIAGREAWLADNRDDVERLIQAYTQANEWIFDPLNRDAVIEMTMAGQGVSRSFAERVYDAQLSPSVGLILDHRITQDEFRTVLELRQKWGGFDDVHDLDMLQHHESGLYDTSYVRGAGKL